MGKTMNREKWTEFAKKAADLLDKIARLSLEYGTEISIISYPDGYISGFEHNEQYIGDFYRIEYGGDLIVDYTEYMRE